jgi:hypothetical protein
MRWLRTIADLPVPVGPTNKIGIFASNIIFKKNDWHADSVVWMISSFTCTDMKYFMANEAYYFVWK